MTQCAARLSRCNVGLGSVLNHWHALAAVPPFLACISLFICVLGYIPVSMH